MESLISDHRFALLQEHWHTSMFTWRENTPLHIRQEENPLCVEGRDTSAYFGGPGHMLILMGILLIPAFRLCILGLSYQRVIGLIGCGPVIVHGQRLTMKVKTYLVCNRSKFVYLVSNLLHVWRWMCFLFWLGFNNFIWNLLINTMSQNWVVFCIYIIYVRLIDECNTYILNNGLMGNCNDFWYWK